MGEPGFTPFVYLETPTIEQAWEALDRNCWAAQGLSAEVARTFAHAVVTACCDYQFASDAERRLFVDHFIPTIRERIDQLHQ